MSWRAAVAIVLVACGPQLVPGPPSAPPAGAELTTDASDAALPDARVPEASATDGARAFACDRRPSDAGDAAEVLYACARRAYDGDDLADAARMFREVAFDHPTSAVATYAAQLYLDCLNRMGDHQTDWHAELTTMLGLYCAAGRARHEDDCRKFELIDAQVRFRAAAALYEQASRDRSDAGMERAGDAFVALYRHDCGKTVVKCDELLYNAVVAYLAAGKPDRAQATAQIVLDPKNHMSDGPLARKLRCKLGDGGAC